MMLKVTIPFALYWRTTASVAEGSVGEASAPSRTARGATVVRNLLAELLEGAERQRSTDREGEDRQGKVGRRPHRINEGSRDKAADPWVQDQACDDVSTHPRESELPYDLPEDVAQHDGQAGCQ
jgi:hypothetical protein